MQERIQKLLASRGIASRRDCEELIKEERVTVNGQVAKLGQNADIAKDILLVDGQRLPVVKMRYIMLFKPDGYVCSVEDPYEHKLVTDIVHVPERIYPVGRLDKDAEGLLLMTNDGEFANKIMHPRYETEKTYFVRLRSPLSKEDPGKLYSGMQLRYYKVGPVKLRFIGSRRDVVQVTLHEGRHKIVKLLFKALNNRVIYLRRDAIGGLKLRGVKVGHWRDLNKDEIAMLQRETLIAKKGTDPENSRPRAEVRSHPPAYFQSDAARSHAPTHQVPSGNAARPHAQAQQIPQRNAMRSRAPRKQIAPRNRLN